VKEQTEANEKLLEERKKLSHELEEKNLKCRELENYIRRINEHQQHVESENNELVSRRYQLEVQIKTNEQKKKRLNKNINRMNKEIDDSMKATKKLEKEIEKTINHFKELKTQTEVTEKQIEEKKKTLKELKRDKEKLEEEHHIAVGQLVKKGLESKTMEAKKTKLEKDIQEHAQQVREFLEEENKYMEEIKFLSTIREKMARTASQAMA
jgi:chromosome segregation ATPase